MHQGRLLSQHSLYTLPLGRTRTGKRSTGMSFQLGVEAFFVVFNFVAILIVVFSHGVAKWRAVYSNSVMPSRNT